MIPRLCLDQPWISHETFRKLQWVSVLSCVCSGTNLVSLIRHQGILFSLLTNTNVKECLSLFLWFSESSWSFSGRWWVQRQPWSRSVWPDITYCWPARSRVCPSLCCQGASMKSVRCRWDGASSSSPLNHKFSYSHTGAWRGRMWWKKGVKPSREQ